MNKSTNNGRHEFARNGEEQDMLFARKYCSHRAGRAKYVKHKVNKRFRKFNKNANNELK